MSRPPARGWIDPNWPPPGGDGDASIIIYGYTPSFALGVLGCVLFFVAGIAHGWQLTRYKTWWFSTMMIGIAFVRQPSWTRTERVMGTKDVNLLKRTLGDRRLRFPLFFSAQESI
jgi:hypothetical protein